MITDKTISKLKSTLDATQQVAIFGHAHPDGDCLGACLAIGAICEKLGSTVRYITPDFPSSQFDFLDKIDQFDIRFPYPEQIDTCIFLDTADRSRS
jgi:phosphoesterase RecJ-like protein